MQCILVIARSVRHLPAPVSDAFEAENLALVHFAVAVNCWLFAKRGLPLMPGVYLAPALPVV